MSKQCKSYFDYLTYKYINPEYLTNGSLLSQLSKKVTEYVYYIAALNMFWKEPWQKHVAAKTFKLV